MRVVQARSIAIQYVQISLQVPRRWRNGNVCRLNKLEAHSQESARGAAQGPSNVAALLYE